LNWATISKKKVWESTHKSWTCLNDSHTRSLQRISYKVMRKSSKSLMKRWKNKIRKEKRKRLSKSLLNLNEKSSKTLQQRTKLMTLNPKTYPSMTWSKMTMQWTTMMGITICLKMMKRCRKKVMKGKMIPMESILRLNSSSLALTRTMKMKCSMKMKKLSLNLQMNPKSKIQSKMKNCLKKDSNHRLKI